MCGIFAVISNRRSEEEVSALLNNANVIQSHRGPNSTGEYVRTCGNTVVGLAHQRLSILDLSEAGKQPMMSSSDRYTIVFNGEVYNYLELKNNFGLQNLKGGSDTEVILEVVERIGFERAVHSFNGMWGIVLVDWHEKRVFISRDRMGVKPVHVYQREGEIFIASELKTLLPLLNNKARLNKLVVDQFLVHSLQNAGNETFVEGIEQLSPATIAIVDLNDEVYKLTQSIFWNPLKVEQFKGSFEDYCNDLKALLDSSVELRKRADVPIGLCLSGGLDSSIIASVVARRDKEKLTVLSGVSPGHKDNEEPYIDVVSQFLGLDIEKISLNEVSGDELLEEITEASYYNDAPLPSFSNLMFLKLMRVAQKRGVKVIYSGQGADELFCGYRKYLFFYLKQLAKQKKFASFAANALKMSKNSGLVNQFKLSEAKRYLNKKPSLKVTQREAPPVEFGLNGSLKSRQHKDLSSLSVPYLLHYEDRLSMAHGCEIRLPFMDYRVVEFALSSPDRFKMANGWTKSAMRHAYDGDLPDSIIWRKDKQGFVNPQDHIFKTQLFSKVTDILSDDESLIFQLGLVDKALYKDLIDKYMDGDPGIWFRQAFAPLSLELWLQRNREFFEC
ncbi:asparagine synthase (glutamine-hydrolyzing) [Pseudoalteromonas xiamenensis]|uniref:asparagine synthase (glutamine-hydrolyzing) n=1 Tax=Pseudoalteromonas xiamenensis TaxID=882626 RepID=UPI0027E40785|nr:asparagine synthase (glutamine-hydrolyzing) [Pseudoalteromonas xiamenensis]WMN61178.1 asparagine synthase (glutamine-hydrolyzing) [Pseudoalteromonas xiamenensis]